MELFRKKACGIARSFNIVKSESACGCSSVFTFLAISMEIRMVFGTSARLVDEIWLTVS